LVAVKELAEVDDGLITKVKWDEKDTGTHDPIFACLTSGKPKTLEFLLSLPGGKERCVRPILVNLTAKDGENARDLCYPAQFCAANSRWELLTVLLNNDAAPVTLTTPRLPSVEFMVKEIFAEGGRAAPPRSLMAQVEAAAKREREERREKAAKKKPSGSGTARTSASNAFEDPSVKVLSEKEAKKKGKKREQKKKAKAKKRAAIAAAAGAGGVAGEVSDDSDSSGTDEEEAGMDEEERMLARAPTFDLEKERAARRAARENGGV
jgi:hypothetical protein